LTFVKSPWTMLLNLTVQLYAYGIEAILERFDKDALKKAMNTLDAGESQRVISDALFSK